MNTNDSTILSDVEFLNDTIQGLSGIRKSLSCKYFYDERGSKLFEKICELDEYYLTRAELGIMERNAKSIADQIGTRCAPGNPREYRVATEFSRRADAR